MSQPSRSSRVAFLVVASAILLLSIYGLWSRRTISHPGDPDTTRKITIAQFGDFFLYAPLYVAVEGHLFSDEGIDVTIVNTGGDDKTWAAVIGGSAQFGVADPTFVAVSAARGQNGIVIASIVNGVPFWGITYKEIAPIVDAKDLSQYSVATFPSPSTAYTLQKKMFTDAGLAPNIREAGFGAIIPLLKAGKADIGLELEPNVSQATSDGAKIMYSMAARYGDFAITGLTTVAATLDNDPQLVRKVTSALQKALDLIHKDPDLALKLLAKRFPEIPHGVAQSALKRALEDKVIPASTDISEEAWNKAIKLRIEVGDLTDTAPYKKFVHIDKTPSN